MGWWTEITIIVEAIENKEKALKLAETIYDKETKRWHSYHSAYTISSADSFSLFYYYDRRNYAPIPLITKISKENPHYYFMILASTLDFVNGPAGIIKIVNGCLQDAYGIYRDTPNRFSILEKPEQNRYLIYKWYKSLGIESKNRAELISKFPKFPKSIGSDFFLNRIIPISDIPTFELINKNNRKYSFNWIELPKFKVEDFMNPEVVNFLNNSLILKEIEQETKELLDCSFSRAGYHTLNSIEKLLNNEFESIQQIEQELALYKFKIIEWVSNKMSSKKTEHLHFGKGAPITWLLQVKNNLSYFKFLEI